MQEDEAINKERAKEIFSNIFQGVFLSTNGNPITLEQTKQAFRQHMGDDFSEQQIEDIEQIFVSADVNSVSVKYTYHKLSSFSGRITYKSRDQGVHLESSQ